MQEIPISLTVVQTAWKMTAEPPFIERRGKCWNSRDCIYSWSSVQLARKQNKRGTLKKEREREKNAASVSGADSAHSPPVWRTQTQQISPWAPRKRIFASAVSLKVLLLAALSNRGLVAILQRVLASPGKLCTAGAWGGESRTNNPGCRELHWVEEQEPMSRVEQFSGLGRRFQRWVLVGGWSALGSCQPQTMHVLWYTKGVQAVGAENHRIAEVRRDFTAPPTSLLPWAGGPSADQAVQRPIRVLAHLQGWGTHFFLWQLLPVSHHPLTKGHLYLSS